MLKMSQIQCLVSKPVSLCDIRAFVESRFVFTVCCLCTWHGRGDAGDPPVLRWIDLTISNKTIYMGFRLKSNVPCSRDPDNSKEVMYEESLDLRLASTWLRYALRHYGSQETCMRIIWLIEVSTNKLNAKKMNFICNKARWITDRSKIPISLHKCCRVGRFNSSPPSAAYMRHWIGSALGQIMACRQAFI